MNKTLYHNKEMTHLFFEPFRLKIYEILNKLLWFKLENSPKSVPSTENRFYMQDVLLVFGMFDSEFAPGETML